jgi:hypothetical protein
MKLSFKNISKINKSFTIISLNSTFLFVLSYLLMSLILDISTSIMAVRFYYIESVLYYFGIIFSIADGNPLWTIESVTTIYFTGPFITLFLFGATFLKLFTYIKKEDSNSKLFFMWAFINALNLFFGGFFIGLITKRGFGYFASWNYFSVELSIFTAIVCILVLAVSGYYFTNAFMQNINNYKIIDRNNRRLYIYSIAVIPWIAGGIIILILKTPGIRIDEMLIYSCIILFLIPVLLRYKRYPDISEEIKKYPENFPDIDKKQNEIKFSKVILMVFIVTLFVYRIILSYGIPFRIPSE